MVRFKLLLEDDVAEHGSIGEIYTVLGMTVTIVGTVSMKYVARATDQLGLALQQVAFVTASACLNLLSKRFFHLLITIIS